MSLKFNKNRFPDTNLQRGLRSGELPEEKYHAFGFPICHRYPLKAKKKYLNKFRNEILGFVDEIWVAGRSTAIWRQRVGFCANLWPESWPVI